jgi:hypothetical protein
MPKFQLTVTGDLIEGTATRIDDRSCAIDDATVTEYTSNTFVVANGATDLAIPLGLVDNAKNLILIVNGAVSFKLNGTGNTAIPLAPAAGKQGLLVLAAGSVTSLFVSNASGAPVTINLMAAG